MELPQSYTSLKQSDAGYALIKAASTPYEYFAERSVPELVPSLSTQPEAQLTDLVTTDLVVDSTLEGYMEVYCEPTPCVRMTASIPDTSTADDCNGRFVYQYTSNGGDLPMSSFLDKQTNFYRTVQVNQSGLLRMDVQVALVAPLRIIREHITGSLPLLLVTAEYSPAPGLWVAAGVPGSLFDDVTYGETLSIPVGALGFRLRIAMQSPHSTQLAFGVTLAPDSGLYTFPAVWSTLRPYRWPYLSNLPPAQSFRRLALDTLVTWTGSTLDNGGKIACGLTPSAFCPVLGNTAYSSVAALRVNRYDGPIKFGAHGTWRPLSWSDFDHQDVYNYERAGMKLVFGYNFSDVSGSARARVFGMFGFTSDNPIIGRMLWVPPMTENMRLAQSIYYASFPACTNNKEHTLLKSAFGAARGAGKFIRSTLDRDDQLAALAMMAGQPELAAAIKTAGKINRAIPRKTPPPSSSKSKAVAIPKKK